MAGASCNLVRSLNSPSCIGNVLGWTDLSVTEALTGRGLFIRDWKAEILGLAFGISFRVIAAERTSQGA